MLKKLLLVLYIFSFMLFAAPITAHAQDWGGCVDPNTKIATLRCIPTVFSNIVRAALMFAGTVSVILIIWAGITFVRSGGDQKQVQSARNIITYAIMGLVLVLSSFAIIYLIAYLTHTEGCIDQISFDKCK
jgi:Type IV secretion system pilin